MTTQLLASTFSSVMPHDRIEIREGYADVGDVRLGPSRWGRTRQSTAHRLLRL